MSLLALVLLLAVPARAEDPCVKLSRLGPLVKTCSFNAAFAAAAKACHGKFEKVTGARAAGLKLAPGASAATQAAELATLAANLAVSDDTLRSLRDDASRARRQLEEYRASLLRAGGVRPALAAKLHRPFLDWVESVPCYATNHAALTRSIRGFETKIAELDKTLGDSGRVSRNAGRAERHLSSSAAPSAAATTHAIGSGSPGENKRANPSTLTGVEEDKAKR